MNILEAKNEIKNAVRIYLAKDANGNYEIPVERQRPTLVIGAPGIGKTAIMSKIAAELDIGFLGYTITHHTRQSAIGLPFISQKNFGGKEYSVTEYTMSEIVAEVYEAIETQGKKEGILFIDEINCVSETLAPAMLELLQHKKFGAHKIPDGWVLTAAGNPEEYNKSVNELDMVTLDRVRKFDVEPDYEAFKTYALNSGVHSAIVGFLSLNSNYLFTAEKNPEGLELVTPRSWEDLSYALYEYEKLSIPVNISLIGGYIQSAAIASEFAGYYAIFQKFGIIVSGDEVENGKLASLDLSDSNFEERFALAEIMRAKAVKIADKAMAKAEAAEAALNVAASENVQAGVKELLQKYKSGTLGRYRKSEYRTVIEGLSELNPSDFASKYAAECEAYGQSHVEKIENVLSFAEKSLGKGQELTSSVTSMLTSENFVGFIARFGCPKFYELDSELLLGGGDKAKEIAKRALKDATNKSVR